MHRFYQMWQQLNCSLEHASLGQSSGCNGKLFSWVETTVGAGTNGLTQAQYAQGYYGPSFSEFFQYPDRVFRHEPADGRPVDRQRIRAV